MARRTALLALASILIGGGSAAVAADTGGAGWKLVFADEFDGTALDAAKWTAYADCWGGGNQERQCYTPRPDNVAVHDGALDLSARLETATGPALPLDLRIPGAAVPTATRPFTSGKVSTRGKFALTYGRVEVRAKSPLGQGVWPALWLLPVEDLYGKWPGSGEIDVMESVNLGVRCSSCFGGVENNVYGTLHYGSTMHHQSQQKAAQLPRGTEGDWHTYRVDWSPRAIAWSVDDRQYGRVRLANWRDTLQKGGAVAPAVGNAPFDRPFYLVMNLAVGGLWPESHDAGGVALPGYPKSLSIDWVHIFACDGGTAGDNSCPTP